MKLSPVFCDNMILQRDMELSVWGTSDVEEDISVSINGNLIKNVHITQGEFVFTLPPQKAAENVTLAIGDTVYDNVDIGDVYIASGQSNMEFLLEYEEHYDTEKNAAEDEHLRMYTVGRYSYQGQKEKGYKSHNEWDKWYSYTKDHRGNFSAVASYFAKEIRAETGVPVGIINCSWGGTIAIAWTSPDYIKDDPIYKSQLEYASYLDSLVDKYDLAEAKEQFRKSQAVPEAKEGERAIMTQVLDPQTASKVFPPMDIPKKILETGIANVSDLLFRAKDDPNYPSSLYELMLMNIAGYSCKGVLWYQGESDEDHAGDYGKLLTNLINCWRETWISRNPSQLTLPFIIAQLAPYGTWMGGTGANYPVLRQQQQNVADSVSDVYMASIGDIGNVYDIHPKDKQSVGHRFALLALSRIYGCDVISDAPRAVRASVDSSDKRIICIEFDNCEGLYIKESDFTTYNGFDISATEYNPPVTGGVCGLKILCGDKIVEGCECTCSVKNNTLVISLKDCPENIQKSYRVEMGQSAYYRINLYNKAGLPCLPFVIDAKY